MFMHDVCEVTGLTRKAVEYYTMQNLIAPSVLENGYREFTDSDIERLNRISVLRKLGIGTDGIRAVLEDETGDVLRSLSLKAELSLERAQAKKEILDELGSGKSYSDVREELKTIEDRATITEKLLEAFPGYYGRFICLHFARFLGEPIATDEQRSAYGRILSFLDNVPDFDLPDDLKKYLVENTEHMGTIEINEMIANVKNSIENPEVFLEENKEMLAQYFLYRESDEYRNSPAFRIQSLLMEFNKNGGYYDEFIPAMKDISPSYAVYCKQLEAASEKILAAYPEA
jgi:DNA-binding transcriptional MerR regulator